MSTTSGTTPDIRDATTQRSPGSVDNIVRAARQLFYERGYDATSMQDIADATGLHKSTLYHHIGSKEELLERMCRDLLNELDQSLTVASERDDLSPRERVLLALDGAVSLALSDVVGTNIVIMQRSTTDAGRTVSQRRVTYNRKFTALVRAAQSAGEVRTDVDPALLTTSVLGMINWIVTWYRPDDDRYSPAEVRSAVTSLIDVGI